MDMTLEEACAILDAMIEPARLNDIQELVFQKCWLGYTYQEIASAAGYDEVYIRSVGSSIWRLLTQKLGEKVTKANIKSVLRRHSQKRRLLVVNFRDTQM
ncbi:MAG: hypothetical protein KME64_37030 [Scytonematopsis contorta HA4267-MV1]|jgi:hypothetical protein|nr:hypothetical protein [Scytonematopsis contorta HA4267-MV1]